MKRCVFCGGPFKPCREDPSCRRAEAEGRPHGKCHGGQAVVVYVQSKLPTAGG